MDFLIICILFFAATVNAELSLSQLPKIPCRSNQYSSHRCNFQDLSSKFNVDEFSSFLEQLDSQQSETFKSIITDPSISKSEAKVNLLKFAFTLPEILKQPFITALENTVTNTKLVESEFDKIIENGSIEDRIVYNQIKNIYKNDNLTLSEECRQINTVVNVSPPSVINELERLFGSLTNCNSILSPPTTKTVDPPKTPEPRIIGNNPPFDFNKGLLIPENQQTPNNLDLNQIFGLNTNNNNNVGATPLNALDLIGTLNEVMLLAKNLNNLMNGFQNLFNLNGFKLPNGINLGSLLPSNNNNNNILTNPNPLSNFNLNSLLMPNNNNVNQAVNYPNFNVPSRNFNQMFSNQNVPAFRNPGFTNFPYST